MRNRKSILDSYRALGLQPGASTKDVRRAYLHLVKQWHPDRFQQNSKKQFLAQEKLKEINEAYSALKDYRPGQSWTGDPGWDGQQRPYPRGATAQWREYQRRAAYRPPAQDPYEGNYQYRPVGKSRPVKYAFIWILIVVGNLVVGNLVRSSAGGTPGVPKRATADAGQPTVSAATLVTAIRGVGPADSISQELASARKSLPYFFRGSTKADVYRIQGVPYRSSEKVWQYGASRVYFVGQMVERWESNASSPLKVVTLPRVDASAAFNVGTSAVDVLAIQGQPTVLLDGIGSTCTAPGLQNGCWQYGDSEVYFYQGRVTGWKEVPGRPLRVPR